MKKLIYSLFLCFYSSSLFSQSGGISSSLHGNTSDHDTICAGNCITFWIGGNQNGYFNSFEWEFEGGAPFHTTEDSPTICFSDTGIYYTYVKFYNTQNPSNYAEIYDGSLVTVLLCAPESGFSSDIENICSGDCIQFTDTSRNNPSSWQWYFNGGVPDFFDGKVPPEICYDSAGVFNVMLITSNGAGDDTVFTPGYVVVNTSPEGTSAQSEDVVNYNDTLTLQSCATGLSYLWSPQDYLSCSDCISPVCQPKHDIEYQCVVSNNNGCEVICDYSITVTGYPQPLLPNAFTPNGDGLNDVFGLINAESYDVSFSIFNRWGQMVFHTNDPEQSWDGRFEGKLQAMDTYVYVVTYPSLEDGSVRILRGSLTLLD